MKHWPRRAIYENDRSRRLRRFDGIKRKTLRKREGENILAELSVSVESVKQTMNFLFSWQDLLNRFLVP